MTFEDLTAKRFPGLRPEAEFVSESTALLKPHGFTTENSIACVGTCRDELCGSLSRHVDEAWLESFDFRSLAGMMNLGISGFRAAHAHAPIDGGRERYVYFAFTHIGIGKAGEQGLCERMGRPGTSQACDAIFEFHRELECGSIRSGLDPDDLEQSLLRDKLVRDLRWGDRPDLVELTYVAQRVILRDLERSISCSVDTSRADYAVFCGIQVHAVGGAQFVWLDSPYAVVSGEKLALNMS
jgi:hypothetical protein